MMPDSACVEPKAVFGRKTSAIALRKLGRSGVWCREHNRSAAEQPTEFTEFTELYG
jgi:hypothetical protein